MYNVLIAEDELWIRSALIEMVERIGGFHVVGAASNGEEAWELLREYWPNVLITDIMMPKKDGLWLVQQIDEHHLPIVPMIISGHDDFAYAQKAIRYGVAEYLLKPVDDEEVRDALNRSVAKLGSLSGLHDSVRRIQAFLESMGELDTPKLMRELAHLTADITKMKTATPEERRGLLRIFSAKLNEMLEGEGSPPMPLGSTIEEDIPKHLRKQVEAWLRHDAMQSKGNVKLAMKRACEYIHEHCSKDLTLAFMAEQSHMSVSYFSTLFKKSTGQTFINYLNHIRIEKAKQLLLQPELKVYEAAEQVGFASLPYFNRLFKQAEGISPNEYRKQLGL